MSAAGRRYAFAGTLALTLRRSGTKLCLRLRLGNR